MGRGNACVSGDCEGLFYIDMDNFPYQYEDGDGNIIEDYDLQSDMFWESLQKFKQDFLKVCKSFSECDCWIDHDCHAILENKLFYIVVEDNQWSIAIELLQKDIGMEGLQAGLYKRYLNAIKKCLFNQFDELGVYGGPWTHGTIKKGE